MDKDQEVTLTVREQKRLFVITEVLAGRWSAGQAAAKLDLSLRQMRRLLAAYRRDGPAGLVHGNRGRPSPRRIPPETREKVLNLTKNCCPDYNDHHLTEVLDEEHGIALSRSSLRRIRRQAGLPSPRKRRAPRHRSWRERSPQRGMRIQVDGSKHDWLEGRGPELCLIAAIDDATGEVPWAVFRPEEDSAGYFLLLKHVFQTLGLPLEVYADRHSIFQSPKKASIAEQLAGRPPRSQLGRLLDELDIQLIPAYSPQAKGRIERLFGTFQDRLIKALRRAGADSLDAANAVLPLFLPGYNARFAVPPAEAPSAYRPWPTGLRPDDVFCFKHERVVAKDNTISFSGHRLPIEPISRRRSYAHCRVEVRQQLNGQLVVCYHEKPLVRFKPLNPGPPAVAKFTPAERQPMPAPSKTTKPISRPKAPRRPSKPAADHPWRHSMIAQGKPKIHRG
jgi:transposase